MSITSFLVVVVLSLASGLQGLATLQADSEASPPQASGSIKGIVRDARTNKPIVYANVMVVGTTCGAMSRDDGSFAIEGVPPGAHEMRVMMMGYHVATISDVVIREGIESTLPEVIMLKPLPVEPLKITRRGEGQSWDENFDYPCIYSNPRTWHEFSLELSPEDVDLLAIFYKQIAVPHIFRVHGDCPLTSPLPVRLWSRTGPMDPGDSFFAAISSDTLRASRATSRDRYGVFCNLTVTQRISPDTLEVEATIYCRDAGYGRRALAIRDTGRWEFCLNEVVFAVQ